MKLHHIDIAVCRDFYFMYRCFLRGIPDDVIYISDVQKESLKILKILCDYTFMYAHTDSSVVHIAYLQSKYIYQFAFYSIYIYTHIRTSVVKLVSKWIIGACLSYFSWHSIYVCRNINTIRDE